MIGITISGSLCSKGRTAKLKKEKEKIIYDFLDVAADLIEYHGGSGKICGVMFNHEYRDDDETKPILRIEFKIEGFLPSGIVLRDYIQDLGKQKDTRESTKSLDVGITARGTRSGVVFQQCAL